MILVKSSRSSRPDVSTPFLSQDKRTPTLCSKDDDRFKLRITERAKEDKNSEDEFNFTKDQRYSKDDASDDYMNKMKA